jgi:hypothetical protein
MASLEIHAKKYKMFFKDAENEKNSEPIRIVAYFEAVFHLIETVAAKHRIHINKHQLTRRMLEDNEDIFKDDTERVWRAFQEIENQIRPGQAYGGAINGEALERTKELVDIIREVCKKFLEIE